MRVTDKLGSAPTGQGQAERPTPTTAKETLTIGGAQFTRQSTGLVFEMDIAPDFSADDVASTVVSPGSFEYDAHGRIAAAPRAVEFGQGVIVGPKNGKLAITVSTMPGAEVGARTHEAVAKAYAAVRDFERR